MRYIAIALLVLAAPTPVSAGTNIPLSAFGLPFAPEGPKPISPEHPLFHRIAFEQIENLPGSTRFSVARPTTINNGLRDTLKHMNMLAEDQADAKARLIVTWVSIEPSSLFLARDTASATLAYQLVRMDNGATIFQRTIKTTIEASGSHLDTSMGARRGAIAANFASVAACLDKAAFGTDPADCALRPLFKVRVDRR